VIEADQDGQFGGDLVGQLQRAQDVLHRPCDVRDHRGVLGVGLRLARVEIGDPPHRKSGQVGDLQPASRGGDGQGSPSTTSASP
jgi:hypothetical protein